MRIDELMRYTQAYHPSWDARYADELLDKHEEHLIRRLADLLYVPHGRFIQGKLRAQQQHK